MGSGFFYSQPAIVKRNVKRDRIVRSFLLAGALLFGAPLASMAQPNTAPIFVNGASQTLTICQDSGPNDIAPSLGIADPDPGQIETWTVVSAPASGVLTGFAYSGASTGGFLPPNPATLYYQPNPGYNGPDMFTIMVDDGNGGTATTTINVNVSQLPAFSMLPIAPVCAGATSATLYYSSPSMFGPMTQRFGVTGHTDQFVVPSGVTDIQFDVQGAAGGTDNHSSSPNPGFGGRVTGDLLVSPSQTLYINVGGVGGNGSTLGAAGGYNGGGNAYFYFFGCGGAGGGGSDIRTGGNTLTDRKVVAGGGGGNGWDAPGPSVGGDGGNLVGGSGGTNVGGGHASGGNTPGHAGGQGANYIGWTSGMNGGFGFGGDGSWQGISGGGGGGYYGGGGGVWSGGGGGSSYADFITTSSVLMTSGYNIGDGAVVLNYNIPANYFINWDPFATGQGFLNVFNAAMPSSPISIAVPPAAAPGTYHGTLYIQNATCRSVDYPITITINPIPDIFPVANMTACNGEPTPVVLFGGTVPGTTYTWINDNTSIGLPGSGSGAISSFTATNIGTTPITANITVTPSANGCDGSPISFQITVYPTPMLTSSLTPPDICDSSLFNYTPTSGTPGATFIWKRYAMTGISDSTRSGSDNPLEYLDNTSTDPVAVVYSYTVAANGCWNTQNVVVNVNPTPVLSSSLFPGAICSGNTFYYAPNSGTSGTSYMWNRNAVTGIAEPAHTGSTVVNEILTNTTANPIAVPYDITLSANGCINHQTVIITVNPTPMLSSTSTTPICSGDDFIFGPSSATAGTTFEWYRGVITGISGGPIHGFDSISESGVTNTTALPVTATYTYTLTANSCSNVQTISVVVNPTPRLNSATSATVCDSTLFNYPPSSATPGTTFTWSRAMIAGITPTTGAGSGSINETLINSTANPIMVTYMYTLSANGCTHTQPITLRVNPKPMLSSSLTPPAICDSASFNYHATSNTAGASFAWDRPYIPGIYATQETGIGDVNQQLINSTYVVVDVTYIYTIVANGCTNTESVTVRVNPTPKLNPPFTSSVCSDQPFTYNPTSYTPGANFAWNRPQVPHIGAPTAFGTGSVHDMLHDSVLVPQNVYYVYRLSVNGCTNLYTQTVTVKVLPAPPTPEFITFPPSSLCAGTMFQNFGVATAPGIDYTWSATNGYVYATGANNQYALINFSSPGTSVITLTSNVNGFGCTTTNTYTVNVQSGSLGQQPTVIYYNNQFICLQNNNGTYQWGYDDAHTLDSNIIAGQINQNYDNANPDWNNKLYWCITKSSDGCMQKSYYNKPNGVVNVNQGGAEVKVYPNPASQVLNVEINTIMGGNMQVEVLNMLGQRLDVQPVVNNKAVVNVASLPAGAYMVDCYREGVKVATTRFIKN